MYVLLIYVHILVYLFPNVQKHNMVYNMTTGYKSLYLMQMQENQGFVSHLESSCNVSMDSISTWSYCLAEFLFGYVAKMSSYIHLRFFFFFNYHSGFSCFSLRTVFFPCYLLFVGLLYNVSISNQPLSLVF